MLFWKDVDHLNFGQIFSMSLVPLTKLRHLTIANRIDQRTKQMKRLLLGLTLGLGIFSTFATTIVLSCDGESETKIIGKPSYRKSIGPEGGMSIGPGGGQSIESGGGK